MRVLIVGFDLFASVGGGQTYYRGIIARNPDIQFFYLQDKEAADAPRPPNVRPLPYREVYTGCDFVEHAEPGAPAYAIDDFLLAENVAAAAAGLSFDAVDTPDYYRAGAFLPAALHRHGVSHDRLVLSMHGVISTTQALNWGGDGNLPRGLADLERLQYATADIRYFISPTYQDEWRVISDRPSHLLDPMWAFTPSPRLRFSDDPHPPSLYFVGRTERRKGPHYFAQLLWWLPPGSYRDAAIVGPDSFDHHGNPSSQALREMLRSRQLEDLARVSRSMNAAELSRVFASKAVIFAPSQYDTLNLVALESLFAGCPTVIGNGAGVCEYLRRRFPSIPFLEFDVRRFYSNLPLVEDLLSGYTSHREELDRAVRAVDPTPIGPGIGDIYTARPTADRAARARCEAWDRKFLGARAA